MALVSLRLSSGGFTVGGKKREKMQVKNGGATAHFWFLVATQPWVS